MKLVGICRVFKLEEVSEKCAKGQIYFISRQTKTMENLFRSRDFRLRYSKRSA